jgi:hypothetical protein
MIVVSSGQIFKVGAPWWGAHLFFDTQGELPLKRDPLFSTRYINPAF